MAGTKGKSGGRRPGAGRKGAGVVDQALRDLLGPKEFARRQMDVLAGLFHAGTKRGNVGALLAYVRAWGRRSCP